MELVCKCGYVHHDTSKLKIKRELLNRVTTECQICGKRVIIKSVGPTEFKRLSKMQQTSMYRG